MEQSEWFNVLPHWGTWTLEFKWTFIVWNLPKTVGAMKPVVCNKPLSLRVHAVPFCCWVGAVCMCFFPEWILLLNIWNIFYFQIFYSDTLFSDIYLLSDISSPFDGLSQGRWWAFMRSILAGCLKDVQWLMKCFLFMWFFIASQGSILRIPYLFLFVECWWTVIFFFQNLAYPPPA